jgi:hypothetical protein
MTETNTLPYPAPIAVTTEPADDLTPSELERLIVLGRQLKRGEIAFMFGQKIRGGLYLKAAPELR